jgi:toxin CptA
MSIAVSVIVRPSLIHPCLLGGAGLSLIAAALAVGLSASARFHSSPLLALVLAAAGGVLLHAASGRSKTHRIDISGTGETVLTVQQELRMPDLAGSPGGQDGAAAVALLPGSVVWPPLMLLRLACPGDSVCVLAVWRDSVAPGAWRALAVAVLAIGRRAGKDAEATHQAAQQATKQSTKQATKKAT